jgi:hypothetical protein
LLVERRGRATVFRSKHEQEQGAIVAQRKAPDHPARLPIHEINVLVAGLISFDLKGSDEVTKMLFELRRRSKGEPTNDRM